MATKQSAPVASRLAFLHQVHRLPPRTKVRFIGCVVGYTARDGILRLHHSRPGEKHCELDVDISHVLESLTKPELLSYGAWLSVIGYVQNRDPPGSGLKSDPDKSASSSPNTVVQAVLLWDAGPLKLDEYEKAIEDRVTIQNAALRLGQR